MTDFFPFFNPYLSFFPLSAQKLFLPALQSSADRI
jgi:hypothetical protein